MPPGDVTQVLKQWSRGEPGAVHELAPLVYETLRKVALAYLRKERSDHTLQATGLVNELFLNLMRQSRVNLEDRGHFYSFAAKAMRSILVDHARARAAHKRGSGEAPIELSPDLAWVDASSDQVVDLNAALDALEELDPSKSRMVELRVFLGCTAVEAAEVAGVSKATADRSYSFALAWLAERLGA